MFLARADRTDIHIESKRFDVQDELERIIMIYEPLTEEKNITIRSDAEGPVYADPVLFQRVVNNILSNAIRYTPVSGFITIQKVTTVHYTDLSISDSGNGIPKQHLSHVFDRFYQVDSSRTKGHEGSGLGLSIVKTIMELHQGEVFISSEIGKGTKVTLRFPNS